MLMAVVLEVLPHVAALAVGYEVVGQAGQPAS